MAKLGADERAGYITLGIIEGYDRWASHYDRDPNPLVALEEPVTLELIGDVQGLRVLDLGCGTGRYCELLAGRGAEVVGVDGSPGMLERARLKRACTRFWLTLGAADRLCFPDERFDLVLCALTLSHLPQLRPPLTEMARVLRGGGRLVISDIHPYWAVSGHNYTEFHDEAGQEYRVASYPHLVEEYWRLFRELGLRLEDIREPAIDDRLIARFPSLGEYRGVPLAMVMRARKRRRPVGRGQAP
ncbi:MAG: class I SAM-dependent methyltransferase [Anaerolineae bacterium]|nr:class I SAM-dependent methyltransferase [Anaerolineae bacterium]